MAIINSVLGPLDTANLGFTLSHEHILTTSAGIQQVFPELIQRERLVERAVETFTKIKSEGVDTIVDVSTLDLGRDIRLIEEVSKRSGVNVICATGTWRDIPRVFWTASPDTIADLYIREIGLVYSSALLTNNFSSYVLIPIKTFLSNESTQ